MEASSSHFNLNLSEQPGISQLGQAVIQLSELAESLANEDRTLVSHRTGRPENVAEHSLMLAVIAPAIVEWYFPQLDENLVARYATIHDAVEAYVGDTPTHDISAQGLVDKAALEQKGLAKLLVDFQHMPKFASLVQSYEAQIVPEARFVRVLDKCMPALLHLANGGTVLASYISKADYEEKSRQRASSLRRDYPEFEQMITLREELSQLIADKFLG